MSSLSKIVVSGKVVRAPEKRFTPNTNVPVTEFAILVESGYGRDAEPQPVKVIAWRDLAERVAQDIQKGDMVAVDGRLQLNNFTTSDGQKRREAEIDAINVENLAAVVAGESASPRTSSSSGGGERTVVKSAARVSKAQEAAPSSDDLDAIFANEDEIPF